jgi:hypothetical protein
MGQIEKRSAHNGFEAGLPAVLLDPQLKYYCCFAAVMLAP